MESSCSTAAWGRAEAWSFVSEEVCRARVERHLAVSALHAMPAVDAKTMADLAEISSTEETYADRKRARDEAEKAARDQAEKAAKNKRKVAHAGWGDAPEWRGGWGPKKSGWSSSGSKGSGGKGWGDSTRGWGNEGNEEQQEEYAPAPALEPHEELAVSPRKNVEMIQIPMRHAVTILDSVNRALAAGKQVNSLARSFASSTENEISILSQVLGIRTGRGDTNCGNQLSCQLILFSKRNRSHMYHTPSSGFDRVGCGDPGASERRHGVSASGPRFDL